MKACTLLGYKRIVAELICTIELCGTSDDIQYIIENNMNNSYSVPVNMFLENGVEHYTLKMSGDRGLSPTLQWDMHTETFMSDPNKDMALNSANRLATWLYEVDYIPLNEDGVVEEVEEVP